MRKILFALQLLILSAVSSQARVPELGTNQVWRYTLINDSAFINDCEICGRPTFLLPMKGSFDFTLLSSANRYDYFAITNIDFSFSDQNGISNHVSGGGTVKVGGDFAFQEVVNLQVTISNSSTTETVAMTNSTKGIFNAWPGLRFDLREETKSFARVYKINLRAAPFRELWFSTGSNLTSGNRPPGQNVISSGDLLALSGRVVKKSSDLIGRLGIQPTIGPTPIDAIDVLPGGEIAFSLPNDLFSETIGLLHHGDLLGATGRIVKRNGDLMKAFGVDTNIDYGLDAVQTMDSGEIWFSITTNVFAPNLDAALSRGDLLSDIGEIKKTLQDLLAPFNPMPKTDGSSDFGLDAIYIWPGGEIWFSTEDGFDSGIGPIGAGDLLSDRGYVVFRNLDLVGKFSPIEDVNSFGLDGLFVVTDTTAPPPPVRFSRFEYKKPAGDFELEWDSSGRVFQVEKAAQVEGPYVPAFEISLELFWTESDAGKLHPNSFYRLRQW